MAIVRIPAQPSEQFLGATAIRCGHYPRHRCERAVLAMALADWRCWVDGRYDTGTDTEGSYVRMVVRHQAILDEMSCAVVPENAPLM